MSIYKTCDIRGPFGSELHEEHADRLGVAIAWLRPGADVLVAGDCRLSTPRLTERLVNRLVRSGCNVIDLGAVPTPGFYFARGRLGIETGVMITASHNPAHENGFKVVLGSLPITPQEMAELASLMESEQKPYDQPNGCRSTANILPDYIRFARDFTPNLDGMRVVVDCANGMAALVARQIWEASGAKMTYLFDVPDGRFPNHAPNPAQPANLFALQQEVRRQKADLGVAYDGDADRAGFVSEDGCVLSHDKSIVIFARNALREKKGVVVYDQKCSRIVPEAVKQAGGVPVMERSGHTFIKTTFLKRAAEYAGELSGHHFFRQVGGDDGIIASLIMAGILKAQDARLSEISASIYSYPVTPDIRLPMDEAQITNVMKELVSGLDVASTIIRTDGLRFEFEDSWGMIRPSVTEPGVTLRFEGVTQAALDHVIHLFERAAPELKGRLPVSTGLHKA